MSSLSPPAFVLDAEFSSVASDILVRSIDGTEFAVDNKMLCDLSVVFSDMLSLPVDPAAARDQHGRFIVQMSENAAALRMLFKYGSSRVKHPEPELATLLDVQCAAYLGDKYQVEYIRRRAEAALLIIQSDVRTPLVLSYAVAWKHNYQIALKSIALRTLDIQDFLRRDLVAAPDAQELGIIPAKAIIHLLSYRYAFEKQMDLIISSITREHPIDWIEPDVVGAVPCNTSTGSHRACTMAQAWFLRADTGESEQYHVHTWWLEYVSAIMMARRCRSSASGAIALHRAMVDCVRATFHNRSCNSSSDPSSIILTTSLVLESTVDGRAAACWDEMQKN